MMNCNINTQSAQQTPPANVQIAECQCGEALFVFTTEFVCWEKCSFCAHYRLIGWSSCQMPALVLSGTLHAGS